MAGWPPRPAPLATTDDSPALRTAVDFALGHNVVVVAAAGNDVQATGPGPYYPAAYPGVLSVGAIAPDGSLAGFSDTRTPVSVTAPGVNIISAYPGVFPDSYDPGQDGTSFAAAFVSGVVALVRSYHPQLNEAQVVARIEATADGGSLPGTGHGLVNPVRAVTAALSSAELSGAGSTGATPGGTGSGRRGHPRHVATKGALAPGQDTESMALTVSAGSFGLMILVIAAVSVVLAARRRRVLAARAADQGHPPPDPP